MTRNEYTIKPSPWASIAMPLLKWFGIVALVIVCIAGFVGLVLLNREIHNWWYG